MQRLLSADDLRALLDRLAVELSRTGREHELFVVGGAAVVLGYGARRTTQDMDVYELRDDVRAATPGRTVYDRLGLVVRCASTEQLLAMKLCAGRDEADWEDAKLLLLALEGDHEQVRLRLEPHWVAGKQKRGLENFEDLWEETYGSQ